MNCKSGKLGHNIIKCNDCGHLLSCLIQDMQRTISRKVEISLSSDTNCTLIYQYVYALKDLRNTIAHNDVIYDTRFRKMDASRSMKQCLILETGLPYMNFKTIGDYIILIFEIVKKVCKSFTRIKSSMIKSKS